MLDAIPAIYRHLALQTIAALLGWVSSQFIPVLQDTGVIAPLVGSLLTTLLAALTGLVKQYGLFAESGDYSHG